MLIGVRGPRRRAGTGAAAFRAAVRNRRGGLAPANRTGYRLEARDTEGGVVYRDSLVTITAIPVPHANWRHALAYRFEAASQEQ